MRSILNDYKECVVQVGKDTFELTAPLVVTGFLIGHAVKLINPTTMFTPLGCALGALVAACMLTVSIKISDIAVETLKNKALLNPPKALLGSLLFTNAGICLLASYYGAKVLSDSSHGVQILFVLHTAVLFHAFVVQKLESK